MRFPQAIALVMALLIGVLLFLAPRTPSVEKKDTVAPASVSFDSLLTVLVSSLQKTDQDKYNELTDLSGDPIRQNDSLRRFWMERNDPFGVALVQSVFAGKTQSIDAWTLAGKDFYRAALYAQPEKKNAAYNLCISACEQVLKKDPGNKEARLRKAVCLVEKREDPMKGVMLLKELITEDSTYIDAQLQLGFFSLQSNQMDKAVERFQKVLSIDSTYYDAWLYLAQAQEMSGEKDKAIENYEKYYGLVKDTLIRTELRKYIDKIKTTKTH